ncbi:MAG TPA: LuxR C-terminal-related transcriptional regulator [Chthoniobacterales bacterium]|nr:LuxR C-terminal-related transcriptional regulator [Chthoniobacterales bacterium]
MSQTGLYREQQPTRAVIVADTTGRLCYVSGQGKRLLRGYFGDAGRGGKLPSALQKWLKSAALGLVMVLEGTDGQLNISLLEAKSKAGYCLLLDESTVPGHDAVAEWRHRLTTREMEVLQWVSEGKSNWAIGQILGLTTATVRKHLQNIFAKLGVENRTAAAQYAEGQSPGAGALLPLAGLQSPIKSLRPITPGSTRANHSPSSGVNAG